MLRWMFGAAVWRWFEKLGEEPRSKPQPPKAEVVLNPPTTYTGNLDQPESQPLGTVVYPRIERQAMGTMFELYLAGTDEEELLGAGGQAMDEIDRLDRQLSHYQPESDITRLNAHAFEHYVRVEPSLYRLLHQCVDFSRITDGAFDITAQALVRLWGFHTGEHRVPTDEEIEQTRAATGWEQLEFDDDEQLVHFTVPGMEIALGAIGKGYAVDRAIDMLRFYHLDNAVLHGGTSTIYALGAQPGQDGWEFTMRDPRDRTTPIETVQLRNEAISTSGPYEQQFEQDGVRYCHIIDPRTGRPVPRILSVWVIAPSATESDALSTALFVMGPERAEEFCTQHGNIRAVFVTERDDNQIAVTRIGFSSKE